MESKSIKIVKTGGELDKFLSAAMPDGTLIPMQLDLTLRSPLRTPDFVLVEVTLQCEIPIDEFEILKKNPDIFIESPESGNP